MATAAEYRAEAQRLRTFAATVTDQAVLAELQTMIEELDRRARLTENGSGSLD